MEIHRYPSGTTSGGTGLTDIQLRATPVPVTLGPGPVSVQGPLTDVQLRASAVPVTDPALSALGAVGPSPGAYTALDRLAQITGRLDTLIKLNALPVPPTVKRTFTLLHRG